jgi:hypothetical protein
MIMDRRLPDKEGAGKRGMRGKYEEFREKNGMKK